MLVKKENSVKQKFETVTAYDYGLNDADLNFGLAEINGRYPKKGFVLNKISKELAFVIDGKGSIEINGKKFNLQKGDVTLIPPKKKYFWNGKLKLAVTAYPPWTEKQHQKILK